MAQVDYFPFDILHVSKSFAYYQLGLSIYRVSICSGNLQPDKTLIARLPASKWKALLSRLPLVKRLLRLHVDHFFELDDGSILYFYTSSIIHLTSSGQRIVPLPFRRPLVPCLVQGSLFFGEYSSNCERQPVSLYKYSIASSSLERLTLLHGVRHIHSVSFHPSSNCLFITTGDLDHECSLYSYSLHDREITEVCGGSQDFRIVQPQLSKDSVIFGTDSPDTPNSFFSLDIASRATSFLGRAIGPVYYSAHINHLYYFSTAVEPSRCFPQTHMSIYSIDSLNNIEQLLRLRKDILPARLFQYGNIIFPPQPHHSRSLWFRCRGTGFRSQLSGCLFLPSF